MSRETFEEIYAKISMISEAQARELLIVQNELDSRFSRIKTCLELWNHQQEKIDQLQARIKEAEEVIAFYASDDTEATAGLEIDIGDKSNHCEDFGFKASEYLAKYEGER